MGKLALLCLVSLLASPVVAAGHAQRPSLILPEIVTSPVVKPIEDAALVARVMAQALEHRSRTGDGRVHINAIDDVRSARRLVIPVAGSTAGGGGSLFFRSDVTLINYDDIPEDVMVIYWPIGTSNPPSTSLNVVQITLPPTRAVTYIDFVATVMNKGGLGTLLFYPIFLGQFDKAAAVDGLSRIYTKQPGSNGTVSQEFPTVDADYFSAQNSAASLGLRQDAGFRTNYGIVNIDSAPHTFHVRFIGERLTTEANLTVPAYGMLQTSAPGGDYGALVVHFDLTDPGTNLVSWVAYASSTDNITGDGWVSIAGADLSPDQLKRVGL